MKKQDLKYNTYVQILKEELIPATGCTEPIAIAYASAKAREVLGALPESVLVEVSGNIIKNVKSVVVPNTGGMKGIEAATRVSQYPFRLSNMRRISIHLRTGCTERF